MDNSCENKNSAQQEEEVAIRLYKHVKELSQLKYESELRREDSIIQQSSYMQTAFSFMTATVFMALPIILEHRGNLSLKFLFVATSVITFLLLISLFTASFAQRRSKKVSPVNVSDLERFISDHWENSQKETQQLKQYVELVGKMQESIAKANDEHVIFIRLSMACFLASIIAVAVFYIIAIFLMI